MKDPRMRCIDSFSRAWIPDAVEILVHYRSDEREKGALHSLHFDHKKSLARLCKSHTGTQVHVRNSPNQGIIYQGMDASVATGIVHGVCIQ